MIDRSGNLHAQEYFNQRIRKAIQRGNVAAIIGTMSTNKEKKNLRITHNYQINSICILLKNTPIAKLINAEHTPQNSRFFVAQRFRNFQPPMLV